MANTIVEQVAHIVADEKQGEEKTGARVSHFHSNVLQVVLFFTVLAVPTIYSKFELISGFNRFFFN